MSVPYSQEQIEFRDTLRAFLEEHCSSEFIRRNLGRDSRSKTEIFDKLSDELGLAAGFVGADKVFGIRELGIVAFEVGRHLVPDSIVDDLFVKGVLPEIAGAAPAIIATDGRALCAPFSCAVFSCAAGAKLLLCLDKGKTHLVDSSEIAFKQRSSLDLTRPLFEADLSKAKKEHLADKSVGIVRAAIESLRALEIAGACSKVLEMTVEYVKTRQQFGVPIGTFQAVQHGAAELCLWSEQITALAEFATWSIHESKDQALLAGRSALVIATSRGTQLIEKAIQLHGGIGFTWEHELHLYLRRVRSIEALYLESGKGQLELLDISAA